MKEASKTRSWITLIGFLMLLIGLYGGLRTIINLTAFDEYPQGGVIPEIPFIAGSDRHYIIYENDCYDSRTYYDEKTDTEREPTAVEIKREEEDKMRCLGELKDARESSKINDISQSLFLIFLGGGVLLSRRIFD